MAKLEKETKLDLAKICPELAELLELIEPKASKGDKASVFFFLRYKRIKACMLKLAEENERLGNDAPSPCSKCGGKRVWEVFSGGGVAICEKCDNPAAPQRRSG
jgi:hypothetical protein